jgi:single-stranded DNA-binding protein
MNSVTVTGQITTTPTSKYERFMDHCEFDLDVTSADGRRHDHLHVIAFNELARRSSARLTRGCVVAVTGFLQTEQVDIGEHRYTRVDVGAYEIDLISAPAFPESAPDARLEPDYEDLLEFGEAD